jgi:hypothetical protein
MTARYRRPRPAELGRRGADENKVLRRKMPQVRNRASAALLLLPVLSLCLTGCVRIGAPSGNSDASAQVQAAQLKIEDQAWALRSIFFRPDFGPEWREIRDAQSKPTVGLPFLECLAAVQGSEIDPKLITANAGSPRFTRPNGAFAASNALVTTSPDEAAALYQVTTNPAFTDCIAKNTVDFRANVPASTADVQALPTNVTAGDSTGTRLALQYPAQSGGNESFVADFMVVKVDRALLALWFANPNTPTVQADEDAVVKALVARLTTLPDKNNLGATVTSAATTTPPTTAFSIIGGS